MRGFQPDEQRQAGGRPAADSQQVQSIVNDTSLSKEQRAAKLRQLGFE